MAKISTYPLDSSLSSSDLLIGTDADNANATKNYSLGSIAAFIQSSTPADTLQEVLDAGNTATQDISLTGDITILGATNIITTPNAIVGKLTVSNQFRDGSNLSGINGQLLSSNGGLTTEWVTVDLDYILQQGNSAVGNINLTGNIILTGTSPNGGLSARIVEANQALILNGTIEDNDSLTGLNGQLLSSTVTGALWTTVGLQYILDSDGTAIGDINLTGTITVDNIVSNTDIKLLGTITDGNTSIGTPGQILTATGGNVLWADAEAAFTSYRGSFYSIVDQTLTAPNTAKAIALEVTDTATTNGVSITSDGVNLTRITFAHAGVYNVVFSAQLANSGGTAQTVDFWLRKNGLILADNIPNTNGKVELQGNANYLMAAWNYFVDVNAGDFIHLMFAATSTNISLVHEAASGPHPVTPSVIVTVNKV